MAVPNAGVTFKEVVTFQAQTIAASQTAAAGAAVDLINMGSPVVTLLWSVTSVASTGAAAGTTIVQQAIDSGFTVPVALTVYAPGGLTATAFADVAATTASFQVRTVYPTMQYIRMVTTTGAGSSGAQVCGIALIGGYNQMIQSGPTF